MVLLGDVAMGWRDLTSATSMSCTVLPLPWPCSRKVVLVVQP
jgi:hypothetical protein